MKFLYKGKWVEYDGLCDDAKCPDNLNGHCHKEYWKEYECKICKECESKTMIDGESMSEKQCPHYVDSHSCYWCVFKNSKNCLKQKQAK